MKSAIIFGATGAVGSALVLDLISNNVEVLVLCRPDSERKGSVLKHPLVNVLACDLSMIGDLENTTGKTYDAFFHFAWAGTTGQARNDMYLQNQNIKYSLDAVKAAAKFGCKVFIGAGSQAEYGRSDKPLTDKTPTFPENGYGAAKLCAGYMTKIMCSQLGIRHIWVRILSVYGLNDNANSMVMSVVRSLKQSVVPKLTKGEQLWDYLHSTDAARAFRLLAEKGKDGEVYILGSGQAKPLKEYVIDIRDVVAPGMLLDFGAVPYAENQVMYLCADISKLQNDTSFKPMKSFKEGIKELLDSLEIYYN